MVSRSVCRKPLRWKWLCGARDRMLRSLTKGSTRLTFSKAARMLSAVEPPSPPPGAPAMMGGYAPSPHQKVAGISCTRLPHQYDW